MGSINYVTKLAADVISDNIQMSLNIYKAAQKKLPERKIINLLSNCSHPGGCPYPDSNQNGGAGRSTAPSFSYGNAKSVICYLLVLHEASIILKA